MIGEKISIIVPAYNIENHIENTLKSIWAQTYQNIEVIVVDDGSTDSTSEILDTISLKDERIKVIHKENGGVTSARFCGMKAATGEWVGFVDGDDYIEPDMYQVLITNAKQYGADISHCGYQMVFPSRVDLYYGTGKVIRQDASTGVKDLLKGDFIEPGLWNKLFHRRLIEQLLQNNIMDFSIKINEDLLMNYYLFKEAKRAVFVDECYYHYMVRRGSAATSRLNKNKIEDPMKVLKIIEEDVKDNQEWLDIIEGKILRQLIRVATLNDCEQKQLVTWYRRRALRELRHQILSIINSNHSFKLKIMAIWVAVLPTTYRLVHEIYSKLSGNEKKYEVS